MPAATISSAVKVQERTIQAFLNWLRIAPEILRHFSPGRDAEGNSHTSPEVSLQRAARRFEMNTQVNISLLLSFFFPKEKIDPKRNQPYCHSVAELKWAAQWFQSKEAHWN